MRTTKRATPVQRPEFIGTCTLSERRLLRKLQHYFQDQARIDTDSIESLNDLLMLAQDETENRAKWSELNPSSQSCMLFALLNVTNFIAEVDPLTTAAQEERSVLIAWEAQESKRLDRLNKKTRARMKEIQAETARIREETAKDKAELAELIRQHEEREAAAKAKPTGQASRLLANVKVQGKQSKKAKSAKAPAKRRNPKRKTA